jgi:hypothetical protein
MDDLGPPIAYLELADETPVYDRNGQRVGVVLAVDVDDLPESTAEPERPPSDAHPEKSLEARIRRAWTGSGHT